MLKIFGIIFDTRNEIIDQMCCLYGCNKSTGITYFYSAANIV